MLKESHPYLFAFPRVPSSASPDQNKNLGWTPRQSLVYYSRKPSLCWGKERKGWKGSGHLELERNMPSGHADLQLCLVWKEMLPFSLAFPSSTDFTCDNDPRENATLQSYQQPSTPRLPNQAPEGVWIAGKLLFSMQTTRKKTCRVFMQSQQFSGRERGRGSCANDFRSKWRPAASKRFPELHGSS